MSDVDALSESLGPIVDRIQELQRHAVQQYAPLVDDILRSGSRDVQHIEQTLDGLLDFCGHEPVLQMYKRLCRHYWDIDPGATAFYIDAYRQQWDREEDSKP